MKEQGAAGHQTARLLVVAKPGTIARSKGYQRTPNIWPLQIQVKEANLVHGPPGRIRTEARCHLFKLHFVNMLLLEAIIHALLPAKTRNATL